MKILITGAAGQLGQDLQKLFEKEKIEYIATDFAKGYKKLDITNLKDVRELVKQTKPDVIINCAAYNAVDKAEKEWKLAYNINGLAVRNLAIAASEVKAFLVHYSTDYVFDGQKGSPYTIYDSPNPLSKYGESKYLGEKLLSQFFDGYALIRTSWVFGTGNINFAKKVIEWSRKKDELRLVTDEISAPTYTVDLAKVTLEVVKEHAKGLYHVSNEGICSRYEYAKYIIEKIGWKGILKEAKQEDFNLPAERPKFSKLDNFGLKETLDIEMPHWKNAVDRFLKELFGE
ncbi:dTDP-4-dehydrorhamnose reductase [Thermosipho sp. 1074]|uniref:dTDP-4-dehydrorhamnose reductase n=1 Tax=Thermosipho sp. 1074 TaxID=1643331 RepID=UPI00098500D5|nr:dTDP-4-dehydrorhamnose reductase [Thermosipho sp. 1074]OOC44208.1 dTDP-4-dehydrorhamnose reductase [Thermosipho sp. 1074]